MSNLPAQMAGMRWVLWHNKPVSEDVLTGTASVLARIIGVHD
jgi:hypothetical protein